MLVLNDLIHIFKFWFRVNSQNRKESVWDDVEDQIEIEPDLRVKRNVRRHVSTKSTDVAKRILFSFSFFGLIKTLITFTSYFFDIISKSWKIIHISELIYAFDCWATEDQVMVFIIFYRRLLGWTYVHWQRRSSMGKCNYTSYFCSKLCFCYMVFTCKQR